MKKLTVGRMALARLRANRKSYAALALGIFLSVFLVSALCLCLYGVYLAQQERQYRQTGYLDLFDLDNPSRSDREIEDLGYFDRLGHIYVAGTVNDTSYYLGYGDETGIALVNYRLIEGRMPEKAGEIAMEQSVLVSIAEEAALGDTLDLTVTPVDGVEETRQFTLVGILEEKAGYFQPSNISIAYYDNPVTSFPAILLSQQEPGFATGRLAVHRVMRLKKGASMQAALLAYNRGGYEHLFYINASGEVLDGYSNDWGSILYIRDDFFLSLLFTGLLAAALLIGCCVGIAGSMEGLLSRREEEIGILRAVGATKRQIRRIFGRESLVLAAVTAPAAIACGCGVTALLAWRLPEQLVFRASPWLLLPIAVLSVAVVLLSGYLPLRRAAEKMPMGVLRDTGLLRRAAKLRSRTRFRPARLLAARSLRFHPGRQAGAFLLTLLMLLSAGMMMEALGADVDIFTTDTHSFSVSAPWGSMFWSSFVTVNPSHTMTWRDVARLERLPGVDRVEVECRQELTLVREGDSCYFIGPTGAREDEIRQFQAVLETDQPLEPMLPICASSAFTPEFLEECAPGVDVAALDAGREVIVVAPTWWEFRREDGSGYGYMAAEAEHPQDTMVSSNDYFYPGQTLSVAQFSATRSDSDELDLSLVDTRRLSLTVGAVCDYIERADFWIRPPGVLLLTTVQGMRSMGFATDGIVEVKIYTEGTLTREAEERLELSINAVAGRSDETQVTNRLEYARQLAAAREQMMLLFGCISLVFFSTAVGLIVSGVTRQLRTDERTIGMLRAVGAEEKTLAACYSLPVTGSILLAALTSLGIMVWVHFWLVNSIPVQLPAVAAGVVIFAAVCWGTCQAMLRLRVRELTRRSIIDEIREL